MILPFLVHAFSLHSQNRRADPERGATSTAEIDELSGSNVNAETTRAIDSNLKKTSTEAKSGANIQSLGEPDNVETESSGPRYLETEDGHDSDDIMQDLEVEVDSTNQYPPDDEYERRSTRYSRSFTTFSTLLAPSGSRPRRGLNWPPAWYIRLQNFLNPDPAKDLGLDYYIPNFRYTPILSGIIIPFSILLEIPGLTDRWYIRTAQNQIVDRKPNPLILDIGLGFSMACAVLANTCLVVRFLERRVKSMTIACIVFLTIHDTINIVTVITFGVEHRFNDGFTYGQSFWMTVCSTIASSFTNLTLVTDLIRTPDFAQSGSGLTRKQRSLVIVVIILLSYIAFGALIHCFLLDLSFIDALYFTACSIETIGFGDISPASHGSGAQIFTCIYSAFGILNLALAVGMTRETLLEGLEVGYRKRVKEVQAKRKAARWNRSVQTRWRDAVEWRLREADESVWVRDEHSTSQIPFVSFFRKHSPLSESTNSSNKHYTSSSGIGYGHHPRGMHLNLEALTGAQLEAAAMEAGVPLHLLLPTGFKIRNGVVSHGRKRSGLESGDVEPGTVVPVPPDGVLRDPDDTGMPLTHARLGRMIAMIGQFALAVHSSGRLAGDITLEVPRKTKPVDHPNSKASLTQQYDSFKQGMEREEQKAFYARLTVAWVLFILFWMVGSAIFMKTEGWTYGTAMYFCFIAFSTLGYGDYHLTSPAGRSIFVVWALLGVATMTILISVISEAYSTRYKNAIHSNIFNQAVKRYRARTRATTSEKEASSNSKTGKPSEISSADALLESQEKLKEQLEALPAQILRQARTFHEHVQYFVGRGSTSGGGLDADSPVPESLKNLMNAITGSELLGERVKEEIMQDEDVRHTLFTLSIEKPLHKLIEMAEEALDALKKRDALADLQKQDSGQQEIKVEDTTTPIRLEEHSGFSTAIESSGLSSKLNSRTDKQY